MILKRCVLIVTAFLLISPNVWASCPVHVWSHGFGDGSHNSGYCVAVDSYGNIVIAGVFLGTVDFGGGPLVCVGNSDAFVAKFDPSGNHLWSQRFGDSGYQHVYSAAFDGSGNVVVTGYFDGTLDFGGGPLPSSGLVDIFVAKLDPNGNHIWSQCFGDANRQVAYSVAIDGSDNVIITGDMAGTVDFGGEPLTGAGGMDIFVVKLASDGTHLWSQRFGDGSSYQFGFNIALDSSGNVVVMGEMAGTVNFGGGPLTSAGSRDIFVVKFNPNGTHLWSQCFGDPQLQYEGDVAVDGSGNVIIAGKFYGSIDFGGGSFTSAGDVDLYVAKFDPNGTHLWSQRFGDANYDGAQAVAVNSHDHIIVAGLFRGTTDLGGGPLTSVGGYDVFVAEFDSDGNHIWSAGYGGPDLQDPRDLAVDNWDAIVVGGGFNGTFDLGGVPITSAGGRDVFLAKFDINTPAGQDVVVQPVDESTGDSPVTLTFDEVTTGGETSVSVAETGPPPPSGFKLGTKPTGEAVNYELATTASYVGLVEICIDYSNLKFGDPRFHREENLQVFRLENGLWVPLFSSLDMVNDIICTQVTSFSNFAIFEAKSYGAITGTVTADCPAADTPLHGVTIDFYSVATGALAASTQSEQDGSYTSEVMEAGDYSATIVVPLGYDAALDEISVTVYGDDVVAVDFSLACLEIIPQQHSIGFWKHQVGVALGGKGNGQIDATTLCEYLDLIEGHFNSNAVNQVIIYEPPTSGECVHKLEVAMCLLNLKGNAVMTARAKQQLMALLLNVAGGKLSLREIISEDGATVSQAITYCDHIIDDDAANHEIAKTIADMINSATTVPAGIIPLTMDDIAYSSRARPNPPRDFGLVQNYPNPFNPATTIRYELAAPTRVRLRIYDVTGRLVTQLLDAQRPEGSHTVEWNATNRLGQPVASGIYLVRFEARGHVQTMHMVVLK